MIGDAVRELLVNDATLSGIIGKRMFPQMIPQGTGMPVIAYSIANTQPKSCKVNGEYLDEVDISLLIFSKNYGETEQIGQRVRKVIDDYSGTVKGKELSISYNGEKDNASEQAKLYGKSQSYKVFYKH
ncbi:DUF3168 domain-containing protein [Rapidithrix thailandica]|uniref:DUF3168 domain-containing protein n=1 Tax=Rapidithrix thailandica TaxID=413964 RepID=A0AAW9RZT8_9BACT